MSQIVLAPVAGAVVVTLGASAAFGINSVTFLASAIALSGLSSPPTESGERGSSRAEIVEGIQIIRKSRLLATLAAVQGLAALSTAVSGVPPDKARDRTRQHRHVALGRSLRRPETRSWPSRRTIWPLSSQRSADREADCAQNIRPARQPIHPLTRQDVRLAAPAGVRFDGVRGGRH